MLAEHQLLFANQATKHHHHFVLRSSPWRVNEGNDDDVYLYEHYGKPCDGIQLAAFMVVTVLRLGIHLVDAIRASFVFTTHAGDNVNTDTNALWHQLLPSTTTTMVVSSPDLNEDFGGDDGMKVGNAKQATIDHPLVAVMPTDVREYRNIFKGDMFWNTDKRDDTTKNLLDLEGKGVHGRTLGLDDRGKTGDYRTCRRGQAGLT